MNEVHCVRAMLETQLQRLAEVVAVELIRKRLLEVTDKHDRSVCTSTVLDDFMPPPRNAPPSARRIAPTLSVLNVIATRPRSKVAAGLRSSGRLPRYVYGLVLSTMVKYPSMLAGVPRHVHLEVGFGAVVLADPRAHRRVDEQRMAEPPLHRSTLLDLAYDGGVVPDARVEAEVPTVDVAEADRPDVACGDAVGQQLHRSNRIVGHAEGAGEHVGAAARQRAERGLGTGHTGGDLVERAVAAEADDDIDATAGGILGEPGGVSAAIGLDDLDVVALGESSVHDHGVARRHRGGERVDDEQDAQDRDDIGRARGWVPAVRRGNNGPP